MSEQARGPGETRWEADDEGRITCIRWNNPSWRTRFMDGYDMNPSSVALKLHQAYEMGRKDQAELLRRVVSYGEAR